MGLEYTFAASSEDLDLDLCLFSGQVFRWQEPEPNVWAGVDGPNWYRIIRAEDIYSVESNAGPELLRAFLRLDLDMKRARAEILKLGPELEPMMHAWSGLRMMQPSSVHETLFCFLCTANNHLSRIGGMVRKLASYGEPLCEVSGQMLTLFPTVERIAAMSEQGLREDGFGYRGKSIPIVARQIMEKGEGWLESLRNAPYEEAHRELTGLYSVGPKLADCVALYGLGKLEAAPIDTHLWQAICRLYKPGWQDKSLTDARYREGSALMRKRFGDLAGLAHLFLYFDNQQTWRTVR